MDDADLRTDLMSFVNKHIDNIRDVTTIGPSKAQHKVYKRAMRKHRLWLLKDLL